MATEKEKETVVALRPPTHTPKHIIIMTPANKLLVMADKDRKKRVVALRPHTHQSIIGAAGHIIMTPSEPVVGFGISKYDHFPNRASNMTVEKLEQKKIHRKASRCTRCAELFFF
jgi:hypothetical protein